MTEMVLTHEEQVLHDYLLDRGSAIGPWGPQRKGIAPESYLFPTVGHLKVGVRIWSLTSPSATASALTRVWPTKYINPLLQPGEASFFLKALGNLDLVQYTLECYIAKPLKEIIRE